MKNIEDLEKLIEVYDEYLSFIRDSSDDPILIASTHGWKCPKSIINQGIKFRDKIEKIKQKIAKD